MTGARSEFICFEPALVINHLGTGYYDRSGLDGPALVLDVDRRHTDPDSIPWYDWIGQACEVTGDDHLRLAGPDQHA